MNPFTFCRLARTFLMSVSLTMTLLFARNLLAQEPTDAETDEAAKPIQLKLNYRSNACEAHISIEYYQRGDHAHVKTELTNDDCGASSGSYTIKVRYKGEDQEIQNIDYPENWERFDALPIETGKDYFVGDDVDIIRVRIRNLKCECTTDVTESE